MADFFKGLSGGFQTGLQISEALRAKQERERLREAMGLTPQEMQQRQATPEEFGRAQAETQGLAAQDAAEFGLTPLDQPTYAPQMPVQGQRIGAAQYGLGGQTFTRMPTQQEIQQARYGAMADVIAERDPARAMQMRQQLDEQAYQLKRRPLELQSLEGQIEGQGLSRQAQRLTISESERKVRQDESNRLAQGRLAELSADGTPIDTATANRIARETGADMTFVTDAVLKQYSLTKASANDLIERQLAEFDKAAKGGLPTLNKYIAERLDPDKTDNIVPTVVQGPDGKLRVMYGDKPLPGYQAYGGIDQLSAAFQGNIKRDPLGAAIQISTLDTQAQARLASQAQIRSSDAQTREAGKSSVEKNLATLQRLGIPVSPEDVRAMAGIKQEKLSPEAAAQLEAITANLKGNESPKALAEARAAITDLFRGEGLKQRNTTIVRGLKTANSKNDLPAAIKQLQDAGVGDETIVGLAKQAGVTLPPSFAPVAAPAAPVAPAAAPAVSPRTGLSSGQQQYGPLTPMATIEADARAGVPAAVAYLKQMADRDRARTENAIRAAQGE